MEDQKPKPTDKEDISKIMSCSASFSQKKASTTISSMKFSETPESQSKGTTRCISNCGKTIFTPKDNVIRCPECRLLCHGKCFVQETNCCHKCKITCSICMDDLKSGDASITCQKCNAYHHDSCLNLWLKQGSICPTCKASSSDAFIIKKAKSSGEKAKEELALAGQTTFSEALDSVKSYDLDSGKEKEESSK
jgi:hypothetical protein